MFDFKSSLMIFKNDCKSSTLDDSINKNHKGSNRERVDVKNSYI